MADEETKQEGEEEHMPEIAVEEAVDEEQVEEESIITEYEPDDFLSGAVNSLDSTLPLNLFEFEYSYGYNCHKHFNLCACDESVVCWSAGSIITFMDVNTKQTWFRRSATGGSVGNITSYRKDPNYRIAIAEGREGHSDPLIILYTWPQMDIDAVLRQGTLNAYSIMDFSPDGELLASVGKEPDYNITIWNWKRHKILLRTSAFTFDVNSVMFSPYCPGQLITAGAAHVKFWKMAETFTGLKLKGELGRFGKTEICDVLGVYPMPDEKVLTGCEWGNILVWEAGLVKVEVTQRGRKSCHKAPIIQFMLSAAGDEVTTLARDGCVRAWYWDTVEQADPPEDDPYIELNPVAETCVPDCQIMCLKHQKDFFWYAQDGNGGIWTVDMEIDKIECDHRRVLTCHAGGIIGMVALRTHPILITAGKDGAIQAYNTETHVLLARYLFPAAITSLLYPSTDIDSSSRIIIVGFADGIMRVLLIHPERLLEHDEMFDIRIHSALTLHSEESVNADAIDLIMIMKPHSKALTQILINEQCTLLVTCGEDKTLFMYRLELTAPFSLHRLGFIETPSNIAYMTWKPNEEYVILLCGQQGYIMEVVLPEIYVRKYAEITTFKLEFDSYKHLSVKKYYMRNRSFPTEDDLASIDEEALKAKEEAEKDKDEEDEEWLGEIELIEDESTPLGTAITWAEYCEEGIWVVQKGTGCLLLLKMGVNKILKYGPIPGAWEEDITALKFICEGRYLLLGTNKGYIRVVRMPTKEEDNEEVHFNKWILAQQKLLKKLKGRRLAKEEKQPTPRIDFTDNYYLPMHDNYTGVITCFEFSSNGKFMYTCGADGNIFAYYVNFTEPMIPVTELPLSPELPKIEKLKEPSTIEGEMMSHEQLKQKEEYDKMMAIADAHKKRVRDQLAELTVLYNKLIKANRLLPASQQIDVTLDTRPIIIQEKELNEAKALTIRKLAHQLEASDLGLHKMYSRNIIQLDVFPFILKAIREPEVILRPLRQKNLSKDFYDQLEEVHQKMTEAALRGRDINLLELAEKELKRAESTSRRAATKRTSWGPPRIASFLLGLPPEPPHPLKKALRNYYQRLNRHHTQFIEWQEHLSHKPDPSALPPGAAEALKEAEATVGNRLLKTQPEYTAPPGHNTQLRVCLTRKEIYDTKHEFNKKVLELRQHKVDLVAKMKQIGKRLAEIRAEIPPKKVITLPTIPQIDEDMEFPEKNLEIKPEPIHVTARSAAAAKKSAMLQERRLSQLYPQQRIRAPRVPRFVPIDESRPLSASWELLKTKQGEESTPVESELRERRIERHLYEQDMLLKDAEIAVQKFDVRLRQLQRERIRVLEKSQLLELHLYQLQREMNVLNRFEAHEDRLAEKVYSKLMQVRGVQDQIMDCEHRIDEHHAEKEQLASNCEDLQRQFKKLVQDNKFADFLRRIFKKKYRPPRDKDDDESSESESESSSSEEEDVASLDSRDIGPIRLDPNVCPEGCDIEIYDKTYDLRNTRHKYEQELMERDRLVDLLFRDIDAHNKVKRKLSIQLDKRKNELKEFMMKKQSCLNDVDQVVVLRYDQMRASAVRGCTGPAGLSQTVVFPIQMLMKLRRRVLELQDEIKQQKQRHKVNRTHLFRMKIDLREMNSRADELRAEMREVITRKLGKPRRVNDTLDDLLRSLARRHKFTHNMRSHAQLMDQLRKWKIKFSDLEQKYLQTLAKYSDRLRVAAALQADIYPQKPTKDPLQMPGSYSPEAYVRDVIRLRIVRSQQNQQIKALREEIQSLRLKPLSPATMPISVTPPLSEQSYIDLNMLPRHFWQPKKKYFPITPLGSQVNMAYDVNIMKLVYDCLDAMRVSRDDAQQLITELSAELPDVVSGTKSRFEVVDTMVRKWLLKYGGDPSQYKKQTRAFDALALLADKLIREHLATLEGPDKKSHGIMESVEGALKDMTKMSKPLQDRIGPALAAVMVNTAMHYLESADTMALVVNSLVDENNPLTAKSLQLIDVQQVCEDVRECGVFGPKAEVEHFVRLAINSLKAQIVEADEVEQIDEEVMKAMEIDRESITPSTGRSSKSINEDVTGSIKPSHKSVMRKTSDADTVSRKSVSIVDPSRKTQVPSVSNEEEELYKKKEDADKEFT